MNKKRFLTDVSLTFSTQIFVALLGIILLKLLAIYLPEDVMGIYMVIRRVAGFGFPLVTLNLGMSLARYINIRKNKSEEYFYYSIVSTTIITLIVFILFYIFREFFSKIFFGDVKYRLLLTPMILFLYANSFQALCQGYFRGKQKFVLMNLVNVLFWFVAIVVLYIPFNLKSSHTFLIKYFWIYALFSIGINILLIIIQNEHKVNLLHILRNKIRYKFISSDREFFRYGISRLPSGFLLAGIFSLPVIIASSSMSLKIAAYIGIIVSVVRLVQIFMQPFNLLFLPKFAAYSVSGDRQLIRKNTQMVLEYALSVPLVFGVLVAFLAQEIILLWFGEKYAIVIEYFSYLSPTIGFLFAFILLRGILDGLYTYPYANIITLIGLVTECILIWLSLMLKWNLLGLTISLGAAISILGVCTIVIITIKEDLQLISKRTVFCFIWYFCILLGSYVFNQRVLFDNLYISFLVKVAVTIFILSFSLLLYYRLNFAWINYLLKKR